MKQIIVWVAAAVMTAGCSVALNEPSRLGPVNTCGATGACSADASCVDGACVATDVDLVGLLVEVRPNANAAFGATTSYIFSPESAGIQLAARGGEPFAKRMNPRLPEAVAIRGGLVQVHADTSLGQGCVIGSDRAIPARITFYRVAPFAGFPFEPVTASTDDSKRIDVDLVPDNYDVYIEPQVLEGCNDGKPFPPAYFAAQSIQPGASGIWKLPPVGTLTGILEKFGAAIDGPWKLDLVEPTRGLPVSANATLKKLQPPDDGYGIEAQIVWPDGEAPILRLAPEKTTSDESARATAYWSLAGSFTGTTLAPVVGFSVADLYGKPVPVTLNVLGSDGFTRVQASVVVQSTSLEGPAMNSAAFFIDSLDTSEQGVFTASLPSGEYDLRATPVDNGLAITTNHFGIKGGSTCFCGQQFLLAPKVSLSGAVKTPTGEPVVGAVGAVQPALTKPSAYLTATHELATLAARDVPLETANDGTFSLLVDPGAADLVIQMDPASGYPWLVRPRVSPTADAELGALVITNPALLSGTVRDPNGVPVANAEVNAWFPVRDPRAPEGLAGVVVKIATTQTDESGNYKLVMPSSI